MSLADDLLDILLCPESHEPLYYFSEADGGPFLFCPGSKLRYPIQDDIPVMIVDDAERLDDTEAATLLARAKELGLRRTGPRGEA